MSEQTYIILPSSAAGPRQSDKEQAEITATIQDALNKRANPEPEVSGPIKQILAQQDSVYKYINWENPVRTIGSYLTLLSILFGIHYLPLTQVALKAGVTALGLVSLTEFVSRFISTESLSARLRPKEYKQIPEPTLNATLKDIHDFIQYIVVQVQKIVFGQDLDRTFYAFIGSVALFWLNKVVPAFWLVIIGLNTIFLVPLVASPQGRQVARDVNANAQELTNSAVEKGSGLIQDGRASTVELSSKAKQSTADMLTKLGNTASNVSEMAHEKMGRTPQATPKLTAGDRSELGHEPRDLNTRSEDVTSQEINSVPETGRKHTTAGSRTKTQDPLDELHGASEPAFRNAY